MPSIYQEFNSAQQAPHPSLVNVVTRYASTIYQRPIPLHQRDAFKQITNFLNKNNRPIILDSGCGTGLSTITLAQIFPDHVVIGIDKSAHRLNRAPHNSLSNYLLIRAELMDLWRLLAQAKLSIARHYILFPNPWPKIGHLKRRFYAQPVFRSMLTLSPYLEVRTNWRVFADELVVALSVVNQRPQIFEKKDQQYLSLFEKKYLASSCPIFVVKNELR